MGQLFYNYRDILKAPRLALMGKNIFLMMFHMLIGYLVYLALTYIALLIDGTGIGQSWDIYQLFPFGVIYLDNWLAKLIWYIGCIFWLSMFLRGSLGVARSAFEELRGNFFFSIGEAMSFIRKNSRIIYRALIGVITFIAFIIVLGIIVGLIAKIPVVGELFYGFFYDFPFFVVSLFAVLVIFLLITLLLTGPAAVAVKGEDAMTTLFDGFSAITSQPLRWILYLGGSLVLAKVSTFILTYASLRAMQFTNWTTGIIMGDKQVDLFAYGAADTFSHFPYTDFFLGLVPGYSMNLDNFFDLYSTGGLSWSMTIGGIFIMISILIIIFLIMSYFLNTLVCAQVVAFLDIRNATHQEKLAIIPEEEMEQDLNLEKAKGESTESKDADENREA